MTLSDTDSPEGVPETIAAALEDSSDSQLGDIIRYAQRLLQERPPLTDAVESREGEELVRTSNHGGYTIAVVERPEETGEARGPFVYRVKWAADIDGEGGEYQWHYLGKALGEPGGDRDD